LIERNRAADRIVSLVRVTLASTRLGESTDGELLSRFVATRSDEAFTELVRRLGPIVLGVCQRVLGPGPDADDAFQVTFMVLARKAATVRPPGRVAAWAHGAAALAARKAREARDRRHAHEVAAARDEAVVPSASDPDLARVLDEELDRLPTKFRLPVLLCEVRELTIVRAAAELGWPVGTVASRLRRGRALLAARLGQRGVAGAAVLGAGGLSRATAARVPLKLFEQAHAVAGSGGALPPEGGPPLLNEVLRAMTMSKIRTACVPLVLVAAVAVAALGGAGGTPVTMASPVPPTKAAEPKDPLDRVRLENLSVVLGEKAVKDDLALTAEQDQKLDGLRAESQKRREAAQQQLGAAGPGVPPPEGALELVLGGADPEFDKAAAGQVLKPAQVRRLKQISVQAMGPAALLDRHSLRALRLTPEQEDKIADQVRKLPPDSGTILVGVGVPGGPVVDLGAEKIDHVWAAALEVLTPEQRATWDAMTGKPLPAGDLRKLRNRSKEKELGNGGGPFQPVNPAPGAAPGK